MLVCKELLDTVGDETTAGVIQLEEHDWVVVCNGGVDVVGAMVIVGVEIRVDPIDEVGTTIVVSVV